MLDKRFPNELAMLIWEALRQYEQERRLSGMVPLPAKELAQEWYRLYGVQFEKAWYFGPHCAERHYLPAAHELEPGPMLSFIFQKMPALRLLGQAGFGFGQTIRLLLTHPVFSWKGLRGREDTFWAWLVAGLSAFELSPEQLQRATGEILAHAQRLNARQASHRVILCEAALDYFRRLELAGLGSEAIG
jgi:hypothetical protein